MSEVPVKMYRTKDRLTVAAPTPGLLPQDVTISITPDNHLVLHGEQRGSTADRRTYNRLGVDERGQADATHPTEEHWERLTDEWSVGPYHRELALPVSVNGEMATATYGNGVVVVTLPVSERTQPAQLHLEAAGMGHGERVGSSSFPVRATSQDEYRQAKARAQELHHGSRDPHAN